MVSFISSLFAPRHAIRRHAANLIAKHGRGAIGKAHIACADAYGGSDPKAFEQAGQVLDEVRRQLDRAARATVPASGRSRDSASDPA